MKKCIWCRRVKDEGASFNTLAHTVPKSLGGRNFCKNVCDDCNSYFGQHQKSVPPIETVLKEAFNISRARFLAKDNDIGKNRSLAKFSSIYFKVDFQNHKIKLKQSYRLNSIFQETIARQLKKGIYKLFLEETERQYSNGHDPKFDFIREFARYDSGNYPVFYFERIAGIILMSKDWAKHPELLLNENLQMKYLVKDNSRFVEFEFLGHVIGLPISRSSELSFDNYLTESMSLKSNFFKNCKAITHFNDFDLTLKIID